jgi:hypothetical protein
MNSIALRLAILILIALSGGAHADVTLGFGPVTQVSGTLTVSIVAAGLSRSSAPSIRTYDLDLLFDPDRLEFNEATFGDPALGNQLDVKGLGGNLQIFTPAGPGIVNLFESSQDSPEDLDALQADRFILATLSFGVRAAGSSILQLLGHALGDSNGAEIIAQFGNTKVHAVPIGPSLLWMASGVAGISGMMWRRNRPQLTAD